MSLLLAIDPGVVTPGAAVFEQTSKRLIAAKYFKGAGFKYGLNGVMGLAYDIVDWAQSHYAIRFTNAVFEWPQVYGGGRAGGRKDPNDLLPLVALNAAIAVRLGAPAAHFTPHQWKGSKKKNPTAHWVLSRLGPEEITAIEQVLPFTAALEKAGDKECKHPTMNAIDAAGIGLFYLGRLTRRRVISR